MAQRLDAILAVALAGGFAAANSAEAGLGYYYEAPSYYAAPPVYGAGPFPLGPGFGHPSFGPGGYQPFYGGPPVYEGFPAYGYPRLDYDDRRFPPARRDRGFVPGGRPLYPTEFGIRSDRFEWAD